MFEFQDKVAYTRHVQRAYDRMVEEYDSAESNRGPYYVNDALTCNAILEALSPLWQDRVVLDVGCGTGFQTLQFARKAARVMSLDLSEGMVRKLRTKTRFSGMGRVECLCGDAANLPLRSGSVDFVSAYGDVIGHVPDFEAAIAEMARVCRPGGAVTIEYSNKWFAGLLYSPRELLAALRCRGRGHLRPWTYEYASVPDAVELTYKTFTVQEIRALFRRHGLASPTFSGIHILSSLVPPAYQTPGRRPPPLHRLLTALAIRLGRVDFRLRDRYPFYRLGYTCVVVARRQG